MVITALVYLRAGVILWHSKDIINSVHFKWYFFWSFWCCFCPQQHCGSNCNENLLQVISFKILKYYYYYYYSKYSLTTITAKIYTLIFLLIFLGGVYRMCMKNSVEKMNAVNFLPTIGTAKSWSQIGPDKERWKVGCQVEVALWIRIFWQRQVLHQVIISAKYAHLQTGLTVTIIF